MDRKAEIETLLLDFDVPQRRRDLTLSNVRWLLRNLNVRNKNNPNIDRALTLLRGFNVNQ
jgi:hypothetical protein